MDASREALQTVRDLIRYGVSRFNQTKLSFGHGSDNAWDEAKIKKIAKKPGMAKKK